MRVSALLSALLLASPVVASAAELTGHWRVKGSEMELRFAPCGTATCGFIETSKMLKANPDLRDVKNKDANLRTRKVKGAAMLEDLTPAGSEWKGKVYVPGNGSTYSLTLRRIDADTLAAKGCMAPLLCQTNTLNRVP